MLAQTKAPSALARGEAKTRVWASDLAAQDRISGHAAEGAELHWGNYDAQQRSASGSPVYAKNGCPGDVHTIDYDATGSVAGFDSNSATAVTYDERHLARTMGNRKLTYDLQGHLINERIGDVDNQYFWDGGELIFFITTLPGWYNIGHAVATDHLGAPWRAWAGTSTSWSVSYQPFGKVTPEDGATSFSPTPAIAVRRPGQIADGVSGLYQNWWRYYQPSSGFYLIPDPLAIAHNPSFTRTEFAPLRHLGLPGIQVEQPYAGARNSPLVEVDPTGLAPPGTCKDCDLSEEFCRQECDNNADFDPFTHPGWGPTACSDSDDKEKKSACYHRCESYARQCRDKYCGGPPNPCSAGGVCQ